MFEAEAKERQRAVPKSPTTGGNLATSGDKAKARDQAAAAVGGSGRYVHDAKRVAKQQPEPAAQVQAGAVTLPQPARVSCSTSWANTSLLAGVWGSCARASRQTTE